MYESAFMTLEITKTKKDLKILLLNHAQVCSPIN